MFDFTHTKRPEFIQLVLTIAVVCLALGAITPAASAASYDWEFSVSSPDPTYTYYSGHMYIYDLAGSDYDLDFVHVTITSSWRNYYYHGTLSDYVSSTSYTSIPYDWMGIVGTPGYTHGLIFSIYYPAGATASQKSDIINTLMSWLDAESNLLDDTLLYTFDDVPGSRMLVLLFNHDTPSPTFGYDPVASSYPFYVDVVDSGTDYLISVSGIDGSSLAGSAYTIAVSTFTGGYKLPITSYPMYQGDSPVHIWDSDETFTLPVYLSDGVTPIDYYCVLSFPADPTYTGYQFWWNMTTSGYLDYPFDTNYPPVTPIPTPVIPVDIIPDPNDLNNTVNFTGWYQDQGFEGNNITAPIYSGLRGWFSENMIPVFDFFLMPIGSLSSMISESAGSATDAISDSVDQLSIYAAPMTMVGGYVVLLVPDVVWVVVFAALSIGYVVLLIRISTGSIRDTIGRFLGRW